MLSKQVLAILSEQQIQTTLEEVEQELAAIDRTALIGNYRAKLAISLWDGQSSVNGIEATHIKAQENLPDDAKGYWILFDGKPLYFQTTSPFAGERVITAPQLTANQHADLIAIAKADHEILQTIIARLRKKADTRLQAVEDGLLALMLQGGAN